MPLMLRDGVVFLHAPKTGGNWVTSVLEEQGLVDFAFGHKHADAAHLTAPPFRSKRGGEYVRYVRAMLRLRHMQEQRFFYTVRNPFDWYESWFKYQGSDKRQWRNWGAPPNPFQWHVNSPLNCEAPASFSEFMTFVTDKVPGYATRLFGQYRAIGPAHVLKNETLAEDLCHALTAYGLPHDRERIMTAGRVGESPSQQIEWDPALRQKVRDLDRAAFVEYGYELD
ncbi:MAG: hypothetical protein AAFQ66_02490 [Pseudomonadota bacterium]